MVNWHVPLGRPEAARIVSVRPEDFFSGLRIFLQKS